MSFKASICRKCNVCQKEKCDLDAFVKIRDGKLLYGTIDEKAIGSFKGKILTKGRPRLRPDRARVPGQHHPAGHRRHYDPRVHYRHRR